MKIEKIETFPVAIPRTEPYVTPHTRIETVKAVLVRLTTDDGITGIGEAFYTGPRYVHETLETMKMMIEKYYGPVLQGEDPADMERLVEKMELARVGHPFTRAAVETALYDCLGKKYGVTICQLLGGTYRQEVGLIGMVFSQEPEKMAQAAVQTVKQGHTTLKLKLGDPSAHVDIERVRLIRKAVGPDVKIRIDVNNGYTVNQAIGVIRRLEDYDLICVEDPVEKWNVEGMIYVAQKVSVPICFDYHITTPQETWRILSTRAPRMVKIKLGRVGGYRNAKAIIAMCEASGVPVYLGNGQNTSVNAYAEVHVLCSSRWVDPVGEMIGPHKLVDDIVDVPLPLVHGRTFLPNGPGLGVSLDEAKLNKYKLAL